VATSQFFLLSDFTQAGTYSLEQLLLEVEGASLSVALLPPPFCAVPNLSGIRLCFDGDLTASDVSALTLVVQNHTAVGVTSPDYDVLQTLVEPGDVVDLGVEGLLVINAENLNAGDAVTLQVDAAKHQNGVQQRLAIRNLGAGASVNLEPLGGFANDTPAGSTLPLAEAFYLLVRVPGGFFVLLLPYV